MVATMRQPLHAKASEIRFAVHDESSQFALTTRPYVLRDALGQFVDAYRSAGCADSYCRALNDGRASISRHALLGCRVQVHGYATRECSAGT